MATSTFVPSSRVKGSAFVLDRIPGSKGEMLVYFSGRSADRESLIYRVNAHTGERELIEKIPLRGANVAVDRNQRARFASSRDDDAEPVLRYRPTADADWTPVPKSIAGRTMGVLEFEKDNNTVWAEISDAGEPAALYRVDFAKGTREKVHGRDDQDISRVLYSGFDGVPFGVIFDAGKPGIQYLDPNSDWAKLHAGLMKNFAGNLVTFAGFSRDDSTVLIVVSGDRNPGTYYLLDRSTNKVSLLQSRFLDIDPAQMCVYRVDRPIQHRQIVRDHDNVAVEVGLRADQAGRVIGGGEDDAARRRCQDNRAGRVEELNAVMRFTQAALS